jgi:hypothetical protein
VSLSITSNDWVNIGRRRQKSKRTDAARRGKWRRRASWLLRHRSARARASLCARDTGRQSRGGDRPRAGGRRPIPCRFDQRPILYAWVRPPAGWYGSDKNHGNGRRFDQVAAPGFAHYVLSALTSSRSIVTCTARDRETFAWLR